MEYIRTSVPAFFPLLSIACAIHEFHRPKEILRLGYRDGRADHLASRAKRSPDQSSRLVHDNGYVLMFFGSFLDCRFPEIEKIRSDKPTDSGRLAWP